MRALPGYASRLLPSRLKLLVDRQSKISVHVARSLAGFLIAESRCKRLFIPSGLRECQRTDRPGLRQLVRSVLGCFPRFLISGVVWFLKTIGRWLECQRTDRPGLRLPTITFQHIRVFGICRSSRLRLSTTNPKIQVISRIGSRALRNEYGSYRLFASAGSEPRGNYLQRLIYNT